jgi:hypothetical protein
VDVIKVRKNWDSELEDSEKWYYLTQWCVLELGIPGELRNWYYQTESDYMDFYFRDPRDAEHFILKWM